MTTYDDYDGVWFTIQAICAYHSEVLTDVSFLLLDNHPEGPAASALRQLGDYVPRFRYLPFSGYRSTTTHDLLFREAEADVVCCMDCHVLLMPGALATLQAWFAEHPDSRDLLQGPILWDDLSNGATQMDPVWRDGMFGTWGTDPRFNAGNSEPFEIQMHGMGLFAFRRAAWPGINPRFRGFGGEEGYLHEKIRQAGGRVLCHPELRWVHRFGRPAGVPYPNCWEDRVRNYIIGWSEVGWDLAPIESHFRELLGEAATRVWQQAREQAEHPLSWFDGVFCVSPEPDPCEAHGHPEAVSWRVERVWTEPGEDREVRRVSGLRAALGRATRRGFESVLLLDAPAGAIDTAPVLDLAMSGREWDVCLMGGSGTPSAVAVHRRAFAPILDDIGDDAANFLARWGDLDSYLLQRSHASPGEERLTVVDGIEGLERDDGITVRGLAPGTVYDLNRTASMIFDLCDGRRTVGDIARELADTLKLTTAPVAEVSSCVHQLRRAGILTAAEA